MHEYSVHALMSPISLEDMVTDSEVQLSRLSLVWNSMRIGAGSGQPGQLAARVGLDSRPRPTQFR